MTHLELRAPAKVNARLEVGGRRDDGFHALRTWMLALELGDTLVAEVNPGAEPGSVGLRLSGPYAADDVPADGTNLVVRAALRALERVRASGGEPPALAFELHKEVPPRAGLGGGSSDAAAALRAVEALSGVDLGADWRQAALAALGSDCPFFDRARITGAALCTGRGECVEVLDAPRPEWWVALLTPALDCPTGVVYGAHDRLAAEKKPSPGAPPADPPRTWLTGGALAARAWLHNELETAALAAVPGLRPWRAMLDAVGTEVGPFHLAGSGASFFGVFADADGAREGLERAVAAARRENLDLRGRWVTRTRGEGPP